MLFCDRIRINHSDMNGSTSVPFSTDPLLHIFLYLKINCQTLLNSFSGVVSQKISPALMDTIGKERTILDEANKIFTNASSPTDHDRIQAISILLSLFDSIVFNISQALNQTGGSLSLLASINGCNICEIQDENIHNYNIEASTVFNDDSHFISFDNISSKGIKEFILLMKSFRKLEKIFHIFFDSDENSDLEYKKSQLHKDFAMIKVDVANKEELISKLEKR